MSYGSWGEREKKARGDCQFLIFLLLVFSVRLFKIDKNKNQTRPIDKVQKLGNERR